jgi:hypothetical protein
VADGDPGQVRLRPESGAVMDEPSEDAILEAMGALDGRDNPFPAVREQIRTSTRQFMLWLGTPLVRIDLHRGLTAQTKRLNPIDAVRRPEKPRISSVLSRWRRSR